MAKGETCQGCIWQRSEDYCLLATGKPPSYVKSSREHYRHYFKRSCLRVFRDGKMLGVKKDRGIPQVYGHDKIVHAERKSYRGERVY